MIQYVCGASRHARHVFAILVLIEEPGLLSSLVRDHVCDDDLPLECIQIDGLDFQLARNSQPHRPIECFKQWTVAQRRAFDDLQWQIKAPVLKNWPLRLPVRELPNRTVLPLKVYIREYEGNSEVARVRIHPEHHKFSGGTEVRSKYTSRYAAAFLQFVDVQQGPSETRSSWYALKTLKAEDEVAFKLEVKALMKIKANPHLVKAAAAFKYQNKYHLLFAWADGGNLLKFWKKQPPDLSHKSVCWLAQQCHGLAHGLNGIHNAEISVADIDAIQNTALTRSPTFSPSPQSPTSQIVGNDKQVHGRHGDIKPQNILWFKQDQNEYGLGVLKITDFGVTAFHSAQTTRVFAHEILVTRTYSAPERDILDAQVSRPFDIWSLGCLYLEFITWILLGNKFIEDFAARRMKDKGTRQKFREDNFYTINGKSQILVGTREYATVKPSVTHVSRPISIGTQPRTQRSFSQWIKFLGQQKECSLFLYEFLDYIEKKMLVVDESRRDKSGMVHLQLKTMFDRCTQDPHYALSRAQRYEIFGTNEEQNTGLYWRQMKCFWCC